MGWLNYFDKVFKPKKGKEKFSEKFVEQTKKSGLLRLDRKISDAVKVGKSDTVRVREKEKDIIEAQGIEAEKEFEMTSFGDMTKMLSKMDDLKLLSPIERLARIQCVADIPQQEIMSELGKRVRKINSEITTRNKSKGLKIKDESYEHRLPTGRNSIFDPRVRKIIEEIKQDPKYAEIMKARAEQEKRIKEWVNHLSSHGYSSTFKKLILGTILLYDFNWMVKVDDEWKYPEKRIGKYTLKNFPSIEGIDHLVIAKLNTLYELYFSEKELDRQGFFSNYDEDIRKAVEKGDILEVYYLMKDKIESEMVDEKDIIGVENFEPSIGKFEKFSISDLTNEEQIKKEIKRLTNYVKDSNEFCIKEYKDAETYLRRRDVYVLLVPTKVRNKKGNIIIKNYPEVAITITRDKVTGEESVDSNEIHGNAKNQGINSEYLETARQFVMQKNPETGEYRFKNAHEFGVKFADVIMFDRIEKKINNLGKIDEKTGKLFPDLEPNELKFLYQVYRPVTSFELNGHVKTKIENLKKQRMGILRAKNPAVKTDKHILFRKQEDFEEEQIRSDFTKMFGTKEIDFVVGYFSREDFLIPQILVGSLNVFSIDNLGILYEITGTIKIDPKISLTFEMLSGLKKVRGIVLSEEIKRDLIEKRIFKFPEANDPRLAEVYLPEEEKTIK